MFASCDTHMIGERWDLKQPKLRDGMGVLMACVLASRAPGNNGQQGPRTALGA
jgi:hypothetical protein